MVMFKTWNLPFQIVSGRTISRATGRATLRPVVPPIGCSLTLYTFNVEMFLGFRSLPIQRPTLLIIRSIVGGHDRSYDRSFMTTTSRTIFSNRCWSRDHAYDQSYGDLPPGRKTDRSMRSLLAIVANIADRSHVRYIATDRTIKQSYDPVWQWFRASPPWTTCSPRRGCSSAGTNVGPIWQSCWRCCQQCHCSGVCTWHPDIHGDRTAEWTRKRRVKVVHGTHGVVMTKDSLRRPQRSFPQIRRS